MKKELNKLLNYKAYKLRYLSIISTTQAGSGHPTSCLSAADIVAVLFFYAMQYDPKNPANLNNDKFILSKGHAAPLLYAAWQQAGLISQEELLSLRKFDSVLEGHPTPRFSGTQVATGSLGQGLSYGAGMALSAKLDQKDFYTYVLLGDSEISEGQNWEAAEIAAFYKLDNLIAIIDVNRLGQTGQTMQGWNVENYARKFEAFGWSTIIIDGHNIEQIASALDKARNEKNNKPIIIIAKTIKGFGVSSVEDKNGFHGVAFPKEKLEQILQELKSRFPESSEYNDNYNWTPKLPKLPERVRPEEYERLTLPDPEFKLDQKLATRKAYGQALVALDKVCPNLLVLDAEVKNSTFAQTLDEKDPKKFIQCFIAEQNMISMAVGLYTQDKITYSSTFSAFLSRAFDQIRMAAISRASLRICGSHCGVSIGQDGPSQMGLEDIAMMRTIENSIIFYPSDAVSTYKIVENMANYNSGISYLRTTRSDTPLIYNNTEKFVIGGCKVLKSSKNDVACVVAAGITLHEALKAYKLLAQENIYICIIDLYCVKPLDSKTLLEFGKKSGNRIITVEDHYLEGGLGEAVSYELRHSGIKIDCLAVTKLPRSGTMEELLNFEGISAESIIDKIKTEK